MLSSNTVVDIQVITRLGTQAAAEGVTGRTNQDILNWVGIVVSNPTLVPDFT
jgi:hypothetical protein